MIPFDARFGAIDERAKVSQARLESRFGPTATVFSSHQAGIAACLEVLGTKQSEIPVILPVTSSGPVISAVLRAEGNPILLDIRPDTLQMDPENLRSVLAEVEVAVVILGTPLGRPVDPALLELTKNEVTILDSTIYCDPTAYSKCSFNVFDMASYCGSGTLVIHKYKEQVSLLKRIRSGLLGMEADISETLANNVILYLEAESTASPSLDEIRAKARDQYKNTFTLLESPTMCAISVPSAARVYTYLKDAGYELNLPVQALNLHPDMKNRWIEPPSYPVAEEFHDKIVALPTHAGILDKIDDIIKHISEVV